MLRTLSALSLAAALAVSAVVPAFAADGEAASKSGWPTPSRSVKAGEKVCKFKFSDGTRKVWICDKAAPCCEWEALGNYVKCGTTFSGCL